MERFCALSFDLMMADRMMRPVAVALFACCLGQSCNVNPVDLASDEQVLSSTPEPPTAAIDETDAVIAPVADVAILRATLEDLTITASVEDGEEPLSVDLEVRTVSGAPVPTGVYTWDLGDGQSAEGELVSHSFTAGSWRVMLCATLGAGLPAVTGCKDKNVNVRSRPITSPKGTTITISGNVTLDGAGLAGVIVTASGGGGSTVTDASGYYDLRVTLGWSGTVTPQLSGFAMTPASRSYTSLQASESGASFVASADLVEPPTTPPAGTGHTVSGRVTLGAEGLADVTVSGTSGVAATATDADGNYSITVPDGWTGTISASKVGYAMAPAAHAFTPLNSDVYDQNFTAARLNLTPVSQAGLDQSVLADSSNTAAIILDGSGSHDPDGSIASYVWSENGSTLATTASASVTLGVGLHEIVLRVTDNEGAVGDDSVLVVVANAPSYYVATNGNDAWTGRLPAPDASNTDGPFKTLQRAAGLVVAGDTCVIRGGVYNESVTMTRSGTAQAPITFLGAPGEQAIFDGQGLKDYGLTVHNAAFIVLDGLTVRNYRRDGIWLLDFADSITVRNCVVHGCGGMGIFLRGGDDCLIEYNEIYGNTTGIFVSWRDSNQNYPNRARVRYNLVYDHGILDPESGDGIASDTSLDGVFEYNLCWNNRDDGMDVSIKSMNNVIRHNIALLNGYPETVDGDGNGIKVSTNGGGGHTLHHNFALLNRRSGLDQDIQPGVPRNTFYSNTAYGNGQSGLMLDSGGRGDAGNNAIVKNNILASNNRQNIGRPDLYTCCTSPLLESDYNLIGDGLMNYSGSVQEGPNSRTGDPKFVNPLAAIDFNVTGTTAAKWAFIRNQILTNFALAPGSPCIGGGTVIPGITEKDSPNMGAIE